MMPKMDGTVSQLQENNRNTNESAELKIMKVIIAIDDSQCSQEALKSVAARLWCADTEFRVINVVEPIVLQYGAVAPQAISLMLDAERKLKEHAIEFTTVARESLKAIFGEQQITSRVITGYIADSIIEHAKDWKADLIIVGTHGRTGFEKMMLGSVAEKVVNHAHCSVDVVKAQLTVSTEETLKTEKISDSVKPKQKILAN